MACLFLVILLKVLVLLLDFLQLLKQLLLVDCPLFESQFIPVTKLLQLFNLLVCYLRRRSLAQPVLKNNLRLMAVSFCRFARTFSFHKCNARLQGECFVKVKLGGFNGLAHFSAE